MAKKFWEIYKKQNDPFINDSNDHIFDQDFMSEKYAIVGSNRTSNAFLVRTLNHFGELGGFKKMMALLEDKEQICPVEHVYKIL